MMVLMHTDLPEPVLPAIEHVGHLRQVGDDGMAVARPCPSASGIRALVFATPADSSRSRMMTLVFTALGTSTPTEDLPGTGARMLRRSALRAAAMSLVRPAIFSSFTPGAGCSS
jgi:hypothetical protein